MKHSMGFTYNLKPVRLRRDPPPGEGESLQRLFKPFTKFETSYISACNTPHHVDILVIA